MNSQIQFETNGLRVLVVPVPDGDHSHYKSHNFRIDSSELFFNIGGSRHDYHRDLPEGSWKIHCTTDAMTEEQAAILCVSYLETEYPDYSGPYEYVVYENGNDTAKDELFEILRSNGINPNEKHVILIESK